MNKYSKAYRKANPEKVMKYNKAWAKANPERVRIMSRKTYEKSQGTPEGRLIHNMRSRIFSALKKNDKIKNKKTLELLGCDVKFLKKHIEKQFLKEMSWDNYGEWQVDHIVPIDYFLKNHDFNDVEIQKECFNYNNLQPLWGVENIKKGKKI